MSSNWKEEAVSLAKEGNLSWRQIANELGVARSTCSDHLRKYFSTLEDKEQGVVESEYDVDLDALVDHPEFSISNLAKRLRSAQKANTQLRKIQREVFDSGDNHASYLDAVEKAISRLKVVPYTPDTPERKGRPQATVEVLFSDLQIGKVGEVYNTEKAIKALEYYGKEVRAFIKKHAQEYDIERIIFASLGDIVEDHMKHGVQSATSTDSGLSEQMANAIVHVWEKVLNPIFNLGYDVDVMCIAGNHGSSNHKGMDMYKAGLYSYDYTIYTTWELLTLTAGYKNVKFYIPEGVFGYLNIYGNYYVYEHGYFNTATEKSMSDQMKKRGQQIRKHVEGFRCGDMHHSCSYDSHRLVLNGAFFGVDEGGTEYSGILGFSSIPSQVIMLHTPEEKVGRTTVKEFSLIQVA